MVEGEPLPGPRSRMPRRPVWPERVQLKRLRVPPQRPEREVVAIQVVVDHERSTQFGALRVRVVERFVPLGLVAGAVTGETAPRELRLVPRSVCLLAPEEELDASPDGLAERFTRRDERDERP